MPTYGFLFFLARVSCGTDSFTAEAQSAQETARRKGQSLRSLWVLRASAVKNLKFACG
jgi:hypothetical protein